MKWPFVSRAAFDQLRENRDAWQSMCVSANARAATAEKRYHTLADKVTDRASPVMPERKKDDLAEVIALRAGNDSSLRRHLGTWAAQQRREKVAEAEIMNGILHWKGDGDEEAA